MLIVLNVYYIQPIIKRSLFNDVKVKRYPMALSLVKLHKQPKGLGERPVLGR